MVAGRQQLVYQGSDSQIYVMEVNGSNARKLTAAGLNYSPNWAPGRDVVFTRSVDGGGKQVWAMPADGSGPRQVTNDGGEDKFPAWSPDGATIVYSHGDQPCQNPGLCTVANGYQLWVIAAGGNAPRQLTSSAAPEPEFGESYPAWWGPPNAASASGSSSPAPAAPARNGSQGSVPGRGRATLPATGSSGLELAAVGMLLVAAGALLLAVV